MMSNGKRFRWITLLTLFMTVRSLRAAKQPRCNMTTGIARTGRFVWRNKHGNCDERLIATEPPLECRKIDGAASIFAGRMTGTNDRPEIGAAFVTAACRRPERRGRHADDPIRC